MKPKLEQRSIDKMYNNFEGAYRQTKYPALIYPAILLTMFGLLAWAWALPFPHISFLGKYNGFVNWASILIGVAIYYYLKLSPILSYLMLFLTFAFSYIIIQIEGFQKTGGWPLLFIALVLLLAGSVVQLVLYPSTLANRLKLLINAPAWFGISILKRFGLKY